VAVRDFVGQLQVRKLHSCWLSKMRDSPTQQSYRDYARTIIAIIISISSSGERGVT